jgi:putative FmdB family regulatory protein
MPIYEYRCQACENEFELLIRGQMTPACPACQSEDLEKLLSVPRVQSQGTRDKAMRAAKKRDQKQATERMHTRLEYEANHD